MLQLCGLSAASSFKYFQVFLVIKSPPVAAGLTGNHQRHGVSFIVIIHDNLTVVSAWVVGAKIGDLHGSIQGIGSVSWQHDATAESLIHLDCITFGTEREVSSLKESIGSLLTSQRLEGKEQKAYFLNWNLITSDSYLNARLCGKQVYFPWRFRAPKVFVCVYVVRKILISIWNNDKKNTFVRFVVVHPENRQWRWFKTIKLPQIVFILHRTVEASEQPCNDNHGYCSGTLQHSAYKMFCKSGMSEFFVIFHLVRKHVAILSDIYMTLTNKVSLSMHMSKETWHEGRQRILTPPDWEICCPMSHVAGSFAREGPCLHATL